MSAKAFCRPVPIGVAEFVRSYGVLFLKILEISKIPLWGAAQHCKGRPASHFGAFWCFRSPLPSRGTSHESPAAQNLYFFYRKSALHVRQSVLQVCTDWCDRIRPFLRNFIFEISRNLENLLPGSSACSMQPQSVAGRPKRENHHTQGRKILRIGSKKYFW